MKYVQINTVPYGSTGGIMLKKHRELLAAGVDSYVFWGRGRAASDGRERNFGTSLGVHLDVFQTRLDGKAGFHSNAATKRLLGCLDALDPDIVHLHNLHGYYLNVEMLFGWLSLHRCQVKWTLHDCWAFTGHCAYFTYAKCVQWQTQCACEESCCQMDTYPKTIAGSGVCRWCFDHKRAVFTELPDDQMQLVTPSYWLKNLVEQSFLQKYSVEVVHNTVDGNIFKPTPSDFRERYELEKKYIILGVASPWTQRKGLNDFMRLANELDDDCAIVIVGLNEKQIQNLPTETAAVVIAIPKMDSQRKLVEIYSAADIFFNPTYEDNFPTVNLEAEACGTPVYTYDTGGCRETIGRVKGSRVVEGAWWVHE